MANSTMEKLVSAVYQKDLEALERLLTSGDVNERDQDGRTALMHAVLAEDADERVVSFLLAQGADPNVADKKQQWTALHFAARDQKAAIVQALLEGGAFVDEVDIFGNTPLWRCVMNSSPDLSVIRQLLAHGADPDKKNKHGVSARDTAVNMRNERLLSVLQGQA
jgi:uncharacterized protein